MGIFGTQVESELEFHGPPGTPGPVSANKLRSSDTNTKGATRTIDQTSRVTPFPSAKPGPQVQESVSPPLSSSGTSTMSNPPMTIQPTTPPLRPPFVLPSSPTSNLVIYDVIGGPDIDDTILKQCADLFSNNYGIWGQSPANSKGPKPGSRVKATATFLRQQFLGALNDTVLAICYQRDPHNAAQLELVGHAFATAWDYEGGRVGWVTQLVVNVNFRNRYIATSLLQMLKRSSPFLGITAIGIVSAHPAACHALAKYASTAIQSISTHFYRDIADSILKKSPVKYLQNAKLCGSLFEENCTSGAISSVFTNFYVDHVEPLEALSVYKDRQQWVLGELLDGHEFITILPTRGSTSP